MKARDHPDMVCGLTFTGAHPSLSSSVDPVLIIIPSTTPVLFQYYPSATRAVSQYYSSSIRVVSHCDPHYYPPPSSALSHLLPPPSLTPPSLFNRSGTWADKKSENQLSHQLAYFHVHCSSVTTGNTSTSCQPTTSDVFVLHRDATQPSVVTSLPRTHWRECIKK